MIKKLFGNLFILFIFRVAFFYGSRPFDECFRRPEEEDQFGEKIFLQDKLVWFPYKIDVVEKLEYAVYVRQILVHDFEALSHEDAPNVVEYQEDKGGVETDDASSCDNAKTGGEYFIIEGVKYYIFTIVAER